MARAKFKVTKVREGNDGIKVVRLSQVFADEKAKREAGAVFGEIDVVVRDEKTAAEYALNTEHEMGMAGAVAVEKGK